MTQYEQHPASQEEFRIALISFIGQTLEFGAAFKENEKYITTESPVELSFHEVLNSGANFINLSLAHIGGIAVELRLGQDDHSQRPYVLKQWCGVDESSTVWKLADTPEEQTIEIPRLLLIEGLRTLRT